MYEERLEVRVCCFAFRCLQLRIGRWCAGLKESSWIRDARLTSSAQHFTKKRQMDPRCNW